MVMSKKYKIAAALLVVIAGAWFLKPASKKEARGGRQHRAQTSAKVEKINLVQKVTVSGSIEPIRSTIVSTPYEGYIRKLFVQLGQKVKEGDPLVSVSTSLSAEDTAFPIRSPFNGTVVHVLKTEGQAVKMSSAATDYIMRVDDLTHMFVDVLAPEMDVTKIKLKDKCVIKASALPNKTYEGVVKSISLASQQSTETWRGRSQVEYLVKVEVTNLDDELKPGMSALVDIITFEKPDVLTLPHEFVFNEGDDYFVILKDGSKKQVKIGIQNEAVVEITDGLAQDDQVQAIDFLKMLGS